MAAHSSVLAWGIPQTQEPHGLQSTVSRNWTRPGDLPTITRWDCLVTQTAKTLLLMQETQVRFLDRSPGGGRGNPLQYSCLENPMDREAWWATVHGSQRVRHD